MQQVRGLICNFHEERTDIDLVYSQFQSTGLCGDHCQGSFAYAVVQGNECWCSNYTPADQEDTYSCNTDCPGTGDEWCGNTQEGLFGYFLLPAGHPLGTAGSGGSSSKASSTAAPPSVSTTFIWSRTRPSTPSPSPSTIVASSSRSSSTPLVTVVSSQSSVQTSPSYHSSGSVSSTAVFSAPQVCSSFFSRRSTFMVVVVVDKA